MRKKERPFGGGERRREGEGGGLINWFVPVVVIVVVTHKPTGYKLKSVGAGQTEGVEYSRVEKDQVLMMKGAFNEKETPGHSFLYGNIASVYPRDRVVHFSVWRPEISPDLFRIVQELLKKIN